MNPTELGTLPSVAHNAAMLSTVAATLAWMRWGLRAPWPLMGALLLWQGLMGALAWAGYFVRFDQPWRALPTVAASVAMALWLARRPLAAHGDTGGGPRPSRRAAFSAWAGRWLNAAPPWAWVALQAFRLPLELLLYSLYTHGVIGRHLTFAGSNFDIWVGLTALPMATWLAWQQSKAAQAGLALAGAPKQKAFGAPAEPRPWVQPVVIAWNLLGLVLLLNIVVLAVLSVPFAFQVFTTEPANRVVALFPFVWLPTLLVPLALMGHVVSLRRAIGHHTAGRASSAAPK